MTKTAIAALCALSSEVAPADTWPEDFSFSRLRISAADRDRHEHLFRSVSFDDVAVDAP